MRTNDSSVNTASTKHLFKINTGRILNILFKVLFLSRVDYQNFRGWDPPSDLVNPEGINSSILYIRVIHRRT